MNLGDTLTVVIPVVVVAYALWVAFQMLRGRRKGKCGCGCGDCPLREGCAMAGRMAREKTEESEDSPYE